MKYAIYHFYLFKVYLKWKQYLKLNNLTFNCINPWKHSNSMLNSALLYVNSFSNWYINFNIQYSDDTIILLSGNYF